MSRFGKDVGGCRTRDARRTEAVTVPEIVRMSQEGVPPDQIIERIDRSGTAYRLSASQLADLGDRGVPEEVLDHMQETYLQAVRQERSFEDMRYWTPLRDGYLYGGYPFGWPDNYYSIAFEPPRETEALRDLSPGDVIR